jgi:hypothetical protein
VEYQINNKYLFTPIRICDFIYYMFRKEFTQIFFNTKTARIGYVVRFINVIEFMLSNVLKNMKMTDRTVEHE